MKRKRKSNEGLELPLAERVCRALEIMPESVSKAPVLELHGRSLLKLIDGGKILLYSKEKITVELTRKSGRLCVEGNGLSCSYFNLGAIGIEGKINSISFEEEG